MHRRAALLLLPLLAACSAPEPAPAPAPGQPASGPRALLDPELGRHRRDVGAKDPDAARLFDQGLTLAYAFNHDLAVANFEGAAALDPELAMAWWGVALVNGPHINNPAMSPEQSKAAWAALEKARALAAKARPVDRALIEALGARYAAEPPADRGPLDVKYAEAMRALAKAHPGDADVLALAAEALMDLHPWDLWDGAGQPRPWTPEVLALLEAAMATAPDHPLALHLWVHAIEASATPGKGVAAADRLRALVPAAGHLVHMPAHIDVRVGAYAKASEANRRAMEADRRREARTPRTGFYRVYMLHNAHFLAFSSALEGNARAALEAADAMVKDMPLEFRDALAPIVDGFLPIRLHVLVRFGRWSEVLAEPAFPDRFVVANCVRHYARGTALGALGRLDEAEQELAALKALAATIDDRPVGNNAARTVLEIPVAVLEGELLFRRGKVDEGLARLEQAAKVEDGLRYDEPPDWIQPVRHSLAAVLLEAGRFEAAEQALLADLTRFPENGWSLAGLVRARRGKGDEAGAKEAEARFRAAWKGADTQIASPCLCLPGK